MTNIDNQSARTAIDSFFKLSEDAGNLLLDLNSSDQDVLKNLLVAFYQFICVIDMDTQFKRYFFSIAYVLRYSPTSQDWLNTSGKYAKEMRQSCMLVMLIAVMSLTNTLSFADVKYIESVITDKIGRDRGVVPSLLFFTQALNELSFQTDQTQYIRFVADNFEINEMLVQESALMSTLGAFDLIKNLMSVSADIQKNTCKIFKIFYMYYSSVHNLLPYADFCALHDTFLRKNLTDSLMTRYYFDCVSRLLGDLSNTNLMDDTSFFAAKKMHPFNLLSNMGDEIQSFCSDIQTKTSDYLTNFDQYVKDLKRLFYYVWSEVDQAYRLAQKLNPAEDIAVASVQDLAQTLMPYCRQVYFECRMISDKSLLSMISQNVGGNMMDSMMSGSLSAAQNLAGSNSFLSMLSQDSVQGLIKTGLSSFNFGNMFDLSTVKNFLQLNFSLIAKGIKLFWSVFASSFDLQKTTATTDAGGVVDKVAGLLKDPIINTAQLAIDKLPFGQMLTMQNASKILDVVLRTVKTSISPDVAASSPVFSSAMQMIVDFSKNINNNNNDSAKT